jgi:hypothetical protein
MCNPSFDNLIFNGNTDMKTSLKISKEVIRSRKSKNDRRYDGQRKGQTMIRHFAWIIFCFRRSLKEGLHIHAFTSAHSWYFSVKWCVEEVVCISRIFDWITPLLFRFLVIYLITFCYFRPFITSFWFTLKEEFEDTKGVIRICKSKRTDNTMAKTKGQKDKQRSTQYC